MFITDGVIIAEEKTKVNSAELLSELKEKLEKYMEIEHGKACEFVLEEEKGYPTLVIPEGIKYDEIFSCLGSQSIKFGAINSDRCELPRTELVEVKYYFDDKEKESMHMEMAELVKSIQKKKNEMAAIQKRLKAEKDEMEAQLKNLSEKTLEGYEYREFKTKVVIDFIAKKKLFYSIQQPDSIVKTTDLSPSDMQLQLFVEATPEFIDDNGGDASEGKDGGEHGEGEKVDGEGKAGKKKAGKKKSIDEVDADDL